MDELFIIQRYWGSDEESREEEKNEISIKSTSDSNNISKSENIEIVSMKEKKTDCVDITWQNDSDENNSRKKKKKRLKHFKLNENNNDSMSERPNMSMEANSNIEIINSCTIKEVTESPFHGTNDINRIKLKDPKETKFKEQKNTDEKNIRVKDDGINSQNIETVDTDGNCVDITLQNNDSELRKSKKKKKRLRYFELNETNDDSMSVELNSNMAKINSCTIKGETTESLIDAKNILVQDNAMDSQDSENVDNFSTIGKVYHQKNVIVKHTLPHWLSNPTYISVNLNEKEIPISELNYLDRNTKNNLIKAGINFLFPVQLAVIPWLIQSKEQSLLIRPSDICVSAPTGSGKTLAFVLPIVQSLKDRIVCTIRALVVLPVAELAIQVYKVFETYIQGTDLKVALLTGKKSFTAEQNSLVKSTGQSLLSLVDIVVGTPGRIHDHLYRTQGFCLKRLNYIVIDEADRMMEEIQQGWLKLVEDAVFRGCVFSNCVCKSYKRAFYEPSSAYNFGFHSEPLQKLLYSATLTHDPEQLHSLSLYKPKLFTATSICSKNEFKGSCAIPSGLKMLQVICEEGVKPMVICHLMKLHNFKRVLCFTETVERAHRLHLVLEEMKLLQVREISSFNSAVQRKIALDQFSSGKIDILICSDIVARGIHIENVDCVISYDVPQYIKIYIHRIGRTARAGKTGTAIALLSEGEVPHFKKMLTAAEIELPEKTYVSPEDLKPFFKSFQAALSAVDAKIKIEKNQPLGGSSKKPKKKRKKNE